MKSITTTVRPAFASHTPLQQTANLENLVFEYKPKNPEGWTRVTMYRDSHGRVRISEEGHGFHYILEPTPFVLSGLTDSLKRVTQEQLEQGTVVLGIVGQRALDHLKYGKAVLA
jgi:hypothetical protein